MISEFLIQIWKKEYAGMCLVSNEEILLILNNSEELEIFDGFTIFRIEDFESYYPWNRDDYK